MSYLLTSLNAVTAPGTGSALVFDSPRHVAFNGQFIWTGSPSSAIVVTERSLDGIHFVLFDQRDVNAAGDDFVDSSFVALAIRARLTTLTGGSSPTVTAILAAVDIE